MAGALSDRKPCSPIADGYSVGAFRFAGSKEVVAVTMLRRTAVGLIVGIMAIGLPPVANAAPPDIVRSADNEGYIAGVQDCGDGTRVDISFVFDEAAKFFYDSSGELVRVTRWSKGAGTLLLIDEETEEVLATETGASPSMEIFDLRNGTASVVGMTLHNNVPGSGRVAHAAGIFTFELLSFEVVSVDPAIFEFEIGEFIRSGGKQQFFSDVDWCQILREQM
jgi:hypothetical protein